jgi:hypothetical protein
MLLASGTWQLLLTIPGKPRGGLSEHVRHYARVQDDHILIIFPWPLLFQLRPELSMLVGPQEARQLIEDWSLPAEIRSAQKNIEVSREHLDSVLQQLGANN